MVFCAEWSPWSALDKPPSYSIARRGLPEEGTTILSLALCGSDSTGFFAYYALTLSTMFGFLIAFAAFLVGFAYAVLKMVGFPFPLGNPTIVILVLFLGGIQLLCIGILGEYIGRVYEEVKARPRFIVESSQGFNVQE